MDLADSIRAQTQEHSRMLGTKAELVGHYRDTYGERGWKQKIVKDLVPITGMNAKNLERRFDPGTKGGENRLDRAPRTKREKEQYKELGELIGPIPPKNGYSVTWHGEVRISNQCWPKSFGPLLIQGKDAAQLAATGDAFIILRFYFQGLDMAEGWCGSPTVTITEAHAGQGQRHFQHGPQGSKFASVFGKR